MINYVKNLLRPIYYRLKLEPHYSVYKINQLLIDLFYGKLDSYQICTIPSEINSYILNNYNESPTNFKEASREKINNLLISDLTDDQFLKIDQITRLYKTSNDFCRILHDTLADQIRNYCNSPYTIVNTRMWVTLPGSESFGPNAMHTDGFYPGHFKVMIYPTGLNVQNGYLDLNSILLNDEPPGTVVLFRNSDILHSGVAGTINERLVIEISVLRTFFHLPQYHCGHPNGRHYENFILVIYQYIKRFGLRFIASKMIGSHVKIFITKIKLKLVLKINSLISCRKVNLGSGRKAWISWRCFDALEYPTVETLKFDEKFKLPNDVQGVEIFYSSHNLEHLNDDTVDNLINQMYERSKPGGVVIIKMPDYELLLDLYRSNKLLDINDPGVLDTIYTWPYKNIPPTLENKISMVFCGYMSRSYGNHFEGLNRNMKCSYHGPANVEHSELKGILNNDTVREISKKLNRYAKLECDFGQFNHQNAWTKDDLKKIMEDVGFKFISSKKDVICNDYKKIIPDIKTSYESSMYLKFSKLVC